MHPGGLTALMTAYLTFQALKQKTLKPDQVVPVSHAAWKAEGNKGEPPWAPAPDGCTCADDSPYRKVYDDARAD